MAYSLESHPGKKPKKHFSLDAFLNGIIVVLVIIVLAIFGLRYLKSTLEEYYQPVDIHSTAQVMLEIPAGSSLRMIANKLEDAQIITHKYAFIAYCLLNQIEQNLQAGSYLFSPSQSIPEIAEMISSGQVHLNYFTIPEGYTIGEIGAYLAEKGLVSLEEWQQACLTDYMRQYLYCSTLVRDRLEGFLFPDTYNFPDTANAETIISKMLDNFETVWYRIHDESARSDLSVREVVTIASLIERECMIESEQMRIAGVIYNRLEAGMPLQIDASLLYAMGEHKDEVNYDDLAYDSPYNTYLSAGLPPGPIACPGEAALYAALHPEEHDYFYYVAVGDGSHEFSTNFNDHLKAQRKYQN